MLRLVKFLTFIFATSILFSCSNKTEKENIISSNTFINPLYDGADPWIIKHNSLYYTCYSDGNNISVSESRFLTKKEKEKVVFSSNTNNRNLYHLWAPELHYLEGKWYIYYAASSKGGTPYIHQRSRVLEANNPFGPYEDKGVIYTGDDFENQSDDNNIWAIDMNVFEYRDRWYATWSGWAKQEDTDQTSQHTYIAEMINPWTIGKRTLISSPTEDWEKGEAFELQEGQEALKHNNDLFITYSTRGSWTKHYKLGMLRLIGEDLLSPDSWKKYGPIFQGTNSVHGVGHASFVKSPDDTEYWIFYHSKKGTEHGWNRDVRLQKFEFNKEGFPFFDTPLKAGVKIKKPSGEEKLN